MKFNVLEKFRRVDDKLSEEVLRQLELPMPDDVLEQFILDHGVNEEFQLQYGHLDIHAIKWSLIPITADEVLKATIFSRFRDWSITVAGRTKVVPGEGWDDVNLPPGASEHWQRYNTWMRSPIMLKGDLVKSKKRLHLVEGHTRFGALKGLVYAGVVAKQSLHEVWIGESCSTPEDDGPWRSVLQREHVMFHEWLMRQIGTEGTLGKIASRLITVKHSSASQRWVEGDDLPSVLKFAKDDPQLSPLEHAIQAAYEEWKVYIVP